MRTAWQVRLCWWLIALGPIGLANAQSRQVWRHFNSNNGLPQNSVVAMKADTAGYVWIATESGLVRYDGNAIRTFELRGADLLPPKRIRQIIPTALGEMIVEDVDGNIYDIHGHTAPVLLAKARQRSSFKGGVPSVANFIALSEPRHPYTPDGNSPALSHAVSGTERIVVRRDSIWQWRDRLITNRVKVEREVQQFFFLDNHLIGIGSDGTAYRIDTRTGNDQVIAHHGYNEKKTPWPQIHWHDRRSEAYMAAGDTLYRIGLNAAADTLFVTGHHTPLPPTNTITDILNIPATSIILVGTATTGFYVLREGALDAVSCSGQTIAQVSVYSLSPTPNNGILFATGRRAYTAVQDQCSEIKELAGLDQFILEKDHEGLVWAWLGTDLIRFDLERRTKEVIRRNVERQISIISSGDSVLIGDPLSISSWRKGKVRHLASINADGYQDWPSVLAVDHKGRLMYGTDLGLYIRDGNGAFAPVADLGSTYVRAITALEDLVFIGTYGNGWFVLHEGKTIHMPNDPTGCLEYTHSFFLRNGVLWISTNRGLIRTTMADIRAYLNDRDQRPYLARYGSVAGMENLEFNGGCTPAVIELENGELCYPAIEGLVRVVPEAIVDPFPSGKLIPGPVHVNGQSWSFDRPLDLGHRTADIQFDLSIPYWGDPENAQLEYRIPGIVDHWRLLAIGQRTIEVIRPPPGEYSVLVRKVGSAARQLPDETFQRFTVSRPPWASWPAFLTYVLALVLLTALGVKVNTARLRRRNLWLEENVAQQTEALRSANEELLTAITHQEKLISVISHDVVPPLRFVARVAHSAQEMHRLGSDSAMLGETLQDLSSSTDKLFINANNLLAWIRSRQREKTMEPRSLALRPFIDSCLDRVSEMNTLRGIELRNLADPESMIRTDVDMLGIALNNALVNATMHSEATYIEVSTSRTATGHCIIVRDNGVGIPPMAIGVIQAELSGYSHHDDKERRGASVGLGIVIIAECVRALGATATVELASPGTRMKFDLPNWRT